MKSKVCGLVFISLISAMAYAAVGDGSTSTVLQDSSYPENAGIDLAVPQNQIDLSHLDDDLKKPSTYHLDVSASTWTPGNYSDSTYTANSTNFRSAGLPQISLALAGSGWNFWQINMAPKAGFAYSKYTRNGGLAVGNTTVQVSQDMNLYSLFLGVETVSQKIWWQHLQAYLDLGVMPTWAQASSATFSEGNSDSYWAAKEAAGLIWNFKASDDLATNTWAAELGVETTQGLGGAPLSGKGFVAGLRVAL